MFRGKLLELRYPTQTDCRNELRWKADPETCRWFHTGLVFPIDPTARPSDPNTNNKKRFDLWAIDPPRYVGTAYLFDIDHRSRNAWLSYVVVPEERNKGYATDAVRLLKRYAFEELNLTRLSAKVLAGNDASLGVLAKCGFRREGTMRAAVYRAGQYHDLILFGLLAEDGQRDCNWPQ